MKKGIIFITMLIIVFCGALLIYDFSDIPDEKLTTHKWYLKEKNDIYELDLSNNKFSFINIENNKNRYDNCHTYKYNNSSNIIKLDCNVKNNKIYIATYNEDKLVLTLNGEEKILFRTEDLAYEHNFKKENNLTDEEYEKLYNLNINEEYYITLEEFNKYYKQKNKRNIVLVSSNINYKNILNYVKLSNILNENYLLLNIDSIDKNNLKELYNKLNGTYDEESLTIYEISSRKSKVIELINIKNINEIQ